ncbi:hypothetical protein BXZ70DRAFT_661106 [Cristinia sonorae]|uniref:Uncharacterized protein n=1 Tax=Cristinia sonorae TaxID=1940300 RepID=A0A8K0UEW7_9AGAR|nr:hypothetical protein BXZ70DRAFT_661106 [Cristinia sonorae]
MHPLMPYIHFSIHLAYHSEAAATLFIKNGLLHLIGQLWLHDFPDPHGPGLLSDTKQSIRMDMRAGCILLLGALSRHHPSARELAEYLLSLNTTSSASLCDEKMSVILRSSKSIYYYAGIHTLASHSSPDEFMVIPSLTLFLMEVCVVNGRPLASSEHPFGNPWLSLLTLLSRVETSEYCCTLKDTATRIILWCVSSSDEHWFSLLEALYSVSGKHSTITAFYYIIHHFLSSRDPKMISEENQDVLRRMYRTAVPTPTLKLTNPVDRFVCLLRQGILSYSLFGLMLCNVGASRLVESVMLGSYDFLGGETPSAGERQARIVVCTDVLQKLEIFGKRDEIPLDMRVSHQAFLSKT